jgi:hypothetical protein
MSGAPEQALASAMESLARAQESLKDYLACRAAAGENDDQTHALEYSKTSALLRRRAVQPRRTAQDRDDLLRRAEWFDKRAAVKRAHGVMPRELRTPLETLLLVDELRHALVDIATLTEHLSAEDLEAFVRAIAGRDTESQLPQVSETITAAFALLCEASRDVLDRLGLRDAPEGSEPTLLPFAIAVAVPQ